jgi:glycosyltransferase involved in cell wall biosynthesis
MTEVSLRIAFVTDGEAFHGASPEERALGGSETALVQVARSLSRRGHEVFVYCRCPAPGDYHGVIYFDRKDLVRAAWEERWDVLVISRFFAALDLPLQAGLRVLWNHDILDKPRALAARLNRADLLLTLSEFHAQDYARRLPACAPKLRRTRNGLDLNLLARAAQGVRRAQGKVTYVSRPERGLKVLLEEIWPRLKKRLPQLSLFLCGYKVADTPLHPALQREYEKISELIAASADVFVLGALAKEEYYAHLASCQCLLYPCTFPEVSCIAALEAQALGTPVLTSDFFALKETVVTKEFKVPGQPGSPEYNQAFVQRAGELLPDGGQALALAGAAQKIIQARYGWDLIASEWERLFLDHLAAAARNEPEALAASLIIGGDRLAAGLLLGRPLAEIEEGPVPPDAGEEELLDELAGLLLPVLPLEGAQVGVLASDQGRTLAGLSRRLAGVKVREMAEELASEAKYDAVLLRDRLERAEDPAALLRRVRSLCRPQGFIALCVASGAWPLLRPGHAGRQHDLGRRELERLLGGKKATLRFLPQGMVKIEAESLPVGRWLALAPADGGDFSAMDLGSCLRRARPAQPRLLDEVRRAALL